MSIQDLLKPGETATPLDLSGWIVLRNMLSVGDEVIIDWPSNNLPRLFDIPIRATVEGINSLNNVALNIQTPGACDDRGAEWKTGPQLGWFDVKWHILKIKAAATEEEQK